MRSKNTRRKYKTQKRTKGLKEKRSKNLKGGNKEARYSIDGYMVYDKEKGLFFTQRFGTMIHEEIVKKTEEKFSAKLR